MLQQLQESPPDVLLTVKKRPRHTKIYGQIYIKPYRLPSKKRSPAYRFSESLPSPRIEFIPPQNFPVLLPLTEKSNLSDSDTSSTSSLSMPVEPTKTNENDLRLYLPKPRAVLQRRNTICGDQVSGFRGNITFWHEMNIRRNIEGTCLRDKSVSFGFGLEISSVKRPITCIGIHNKDKYGDLGGLKGSLPDIATTNDEVQQISSIPAASDDSGSKLAQFNENTVFAKQKVVKFNTTEEVIECVISDETIPKISVETQCLENEKPENYNKSIDNMEITRSPIKNYNRTDSSNTSGLTEAINETLLKITKTSEIDQGKINTFTLTTDHIALKKPFFPII